MGTDKVRKKKGFLSPNKRPRVGLSIVSVDVNVVSYKTGHTWIATICNESMQQLQFSDLHLFSSFPAVWCICMSAAITDAAAVLPIPLSLLSATVTAAANNAEMVHWSSWKFIEPFVVLGFCKCRHSHSHLRLQHHRLIKWFWDSVLADVEAGWRADWWMLLDGENMLIRIMPD